MVLLEARGGESSVRARTSEAHLDDRTVTYLSNLKYHLIPRISRQATKCESSNHQTRRFEPQWQRNMTPQEGNAP